MSLFPRRPERGALRGAPSATRLGAYPAPPTRSSREEPFAPQALSQSPAVAHLAATATATLVGLGERLRGEKGEMDLLGRREAPMEEASPEFPPPRPFHPRVWLRRGGERILENPRAGDATRVLRCLQPAVNKPEVEILASWEPVTGRIDWLQ